MSRFYKIAAILVALLALLPACAPAQGRQVVEFWDGLQSPQDVAAIESVIAAFEAQHPDIKIRRTQVTSDLVGREIGKAVASKRAPQAAILDSASVNYLASLKVLKEQPVTEVNDYFDGAEQAASFEGRRIAAPISAEPMMLLYSSDAFAEAGVTVPRTWRELASTARTLTHGEMKGFGLALGGDGHAIDDEVLPADYAVGLQLLPLIWQADGDLTRLDPAASFGLELMSKMQADDSLPHDITWKRYGDLVADMEQGKLAMSVIFPSWLPAFSSEKSTSSGEPLHQLAVSPLPGMQAEGGTTSMETLSGVVLAGADTDAAQLWNQFLTGPEGIRLFCSEAKRIPASKSAISAVNLPAEQVSQAQLLADAKSGPQGYRYRETVVEVGVAFRSVLLQDLDSTEAISRATRKIAEIEKA